MMTSHCITMPRALQRCALTAVAAVALAGTGGCDNPEYTTKYECYFVIDNAKHLDATLASALNPMAPGLFCRISEQPRSGAVFFRFESNQGGEATEKPANAEDLKRTRVLGIYNGLIVGYGNLDNPAQLFAYDNQCRNCYEETSLPRYGLTMHQDGTATCQRCQRTYNLNNRGMVQDGPNGEPLVRYRATSTGPNGVLVVSNR